MTGCKVKNPNILQDDIDFKIALWNPVIGLQITMFDFWLLPHLVLPFSLLFYCLTFDLLIISSESMRVCWKLTHWFPKSSRRWRVSSGIPTSYWRQKNIHIINTISCTSCISGCILIHNIYQDDHQVRTSAIKIRRSISIQTHKRDVWSRLWSCILYVNRIASNLFRF